MKFKTPTLALLFLTLAIQATSPQQGTKSNATSASEYGIDLQRKYGGSEVLALIQIVTEEAEASIEAAFNEGYKQGVLAWKPEADYWKAKAENSDAEIKRLKKERWLFALGGFSAGFLSATGIGLAVRFGN